MSKKTQIGVTEKFKFWTNLGRNDLIKYLKFKCKARKRTGDFPEWSVDDVNDVTQ